MRVERGRLVPAAQFDQERLDSYRPGATVMVRLTEEKDRVLVRKWFAIIGLVLKTCETPWRNKDEAHEAIKLALGIVNLSKTVSGQFMQYPKSLAELDDPEMTEALEQMTDLLSRMTGVDVETLKSETAHVGAAEANPPSDEADSPPGFADAGAGSPADAPGSEEADNPLPSASSTISRDPETERLIQFAKDLLPTAGDPEITGAALSVIEKEWATEIKTFSPAGQAKAMSISKSMRAIFNGNASADAAIAFHAEGLGCEPEEIGGRANG
jgi:hypothetical protein